MQGEVHNFSRNTSRAEMGGDGGAGADGGGGGGGGWGRC